jgi:hypothetical protein
MTFPVFTGQEPPVLTLRGSTASPPPEGPGEVLRGTFALR